MSNEELQKNFLKLEIEISDLKCVVLGQCATIMKLTDETRELKNIISRYTLDQFK